MLSIQQARAGSEWLVQLRGDLDLHTAGQLEQALLPPPGGVRLLILDWSGLKFLDSTGVGELLRVLPRCRAAGLQVVAVNMDAHVYEALETLGVLEVLGIGRAPAC